MKQHTQEAIGPPRSRPTLRVLEGQQRAVEISSILKERDVSAIVGVRTMACDAAIERKGETGDSTIELPKLRELVASALVSRCLMPIRLRGSEMKAMRKGMRMTLGDLAKRLGGRTAPETISRWESEAQPIGSHAERVLRLVVCEELKKDAPGIAYDASKLASMNEVEDPWASNEGYEVPPVVLIYMPMKVDNSVIEAWNERRDAA
jgi:DNA-binding transcriptional regulator YiaG